MDFGHLPACSTCTSALPPLGTFFPNVPSALPPLGTFFQNVPLSAPLNIPFMSDLVFLANTSLAGFLLLFSLWFLTGDSASSSLQEDLSLLLHTLLCVLQNTFLLLYNTDAQNHSFSINSFSNTFRTSVADVPTNNNLLLAEYHATTRTSGDLSTTVNNNNNTTRRHSFVMTILAILGDWSKLEDIYFRFGEHYTPDLAWINKVFDTTYGSNISAIDVIFDDGSGRMQLKSDAIQILKDSITSAIIPFASATDDPSLIKPLVNAMPLYTRSSSGQCLQLRSLEKLVAALNSAIIKATNQRVVTVYLDIVVFHFKDGLNPRDFADVSQSPFPVVVVAAPAAPAAAVAATAALAPPGGTAAPPGSLPITNVFNFPALPSDVRRRYTLHAGRKMMTRSTLEIEFDSSIPHKTLDPTGATMRTTLSYLDSPVTGDRLITRNGAVFTLTSQGPEGVKEFLKNVPSCPNDSPAAIRAWYAVFSIHAANHGIFVQPYFCFRLAANATTGFTIGNDTDLVKFDVPEKFSDRESLWAMTIHTALSKSYVFPAGSFMQRAVVDNWGKGYDVRYHCHLPSSYY